MDTFSKLKQTRKSIKSRFKFVKFSKILFTLSIKLIELVLAWGLASTKKHSVGFFVLRINCIQNWRIKYQQFISFREKGKHLLKRWCTFNKCVRFFLGHRNVVSFESQILRKKWLILYGRQIHAFVGLAPTLRRKYPISFTNIKISYWTCTSAWYFWMSW